MLKLKKKHRTKTNKT